HHILSFFISLPLPSLQALELHDYQGRKSLAVSVVGTVVNKSISIPTADEADALFKLLSPLVKDQADQPAEPPDPDDFEEEQMMMACLVDLFRAPEPDQQYMVHTEYVPTSS
ncbi:Vacuolar protein sorting-associated protein 35, partial [Geodia barretti]